MSRSVDISDSVGSANFTCVVMNSDVFIVPHCSCDCACNLCDIQNGTYVFCYTTKKKNPLLIRNSSVTDCSTDPIDRYRIGSVAVDLSKEV